MKISRYAVEIISLYKTYLTSKREIQALKDISMKIEVSEFVTVSGPSGAGKTTLLNIISGLDRATSGEVFVLGTRLNDLKEDELAAFRCVNIGYVFQDYNLISTLTVRENLEFVRELAGLYSKDFEVGTLELIDMIGLGGRVDHLPDQLSGGERQRLAFARALVNDPSIILADEPTGNLDDDNSRKILEILKGLKEDGKTIIVVTHDAMICEIADTRFQMLDGVVVEKDW